MPFVSVTAARAMPGLRLVGIRGIPSPWTEAARGIFRIKGLAHALAAQSADDPPTAIADWAGDGSVPVVAFENERPRTGWAEILLLAERLAPSPPLIPRAPRERAHLFGLAHEICGQMGLGWCLRLLMIRDALGHGGASGVSPRVASYLAPRYGFEPDAVGAAEQRVIDILGVLDDQLGDSAYFFGSAPTALDVYWATFANLLTPLPADLLPMRDDMRRAYSCANERVLAALTPRLRDHQRTVYQRHLELPVEL